MEQHNGNRPEGNRNDWQRNEWSRNEWSQDEWERQNRRRGGLARVFLLVGLVLLCTVVSISIVSYMRVIAPTVQEMSTQSEAVEPAPSTPRLPANRDPQRELNQTVPILPGDYGTNVMTTDTVKNIAALCSDAVVRITTEYVVDSSRNPFYNDPFFRDFFNPQSPQSPRVETGQGSGFLFRSDGYILTNNHVVEDADKINVYLTSSAIPYEAVVIGRAPELDLAVIKIEGEELPYLYLGDSDQVSVGDWVVAIGNPYGLDHTVTVGVISAKGRPLTIDDTVYQDLLQTDAAINRGNSGGPMLNLKGEVIGINTAVNASAQGIGFAIPSRTVMDVLEELETGVERVRPWIGITMQPMSKDMMQYFNIEIDGMDSGVIVYSVMEKAPADKAGMKRGDVILQIDGQRITDTTQVQGIILRRRVGDTVKILIYRDGEEMEIMVELEESQLPRE